MNSIQIKISGMGLTISDEVYLIEKIFKEIGYTNIDVKDEHPPITQFNGTPCHLDKKITIIADHRPWGG